MAEVAAAAGVRRQTVYAHYPTRDALLTAVVAAVSDHVTAAIDAAGLDNGPALDALGEWATVSWSLLERYPILLTSAAASATPEQDRERHQPIIDRLERLIRRGQRSGEIDRRQRADWLVTAVISLGHAAGQEVAAGRMSPPDAEDAFRQSILRICAPVPA
jgi:AcrR family transcriptional regulator